MIFQGVVRWIHFLRLHTHSHEIPCGVLGGLRCRIVWRLCVTRRRLPWIRGRVTAIRERIPRGRNVAPAHSPPCPVKHVRHPDLVRALKYFVQAARVIPRIEQERSYIDPSTRKRRNNMDLSFRRRLLWIPKISSKISCANFDCDNWIWIKFVKVTREYQKNIKDKINCIYVEHIVYVEKIFIR